MKKLEGRRVLAAVVCVALLLSLLPISAAADDAEATGVTPVDGITYYNSIEELRSENSDYQGVVVRYLAPNTGDNQTSYIRVDFGAYHVKDVITLDYRLTFDTGVVTLLKSDKSAVSANALGKVTDTTKEAILDYREFPDGVVIDSDSKSEIVGSNMTTGDYAVFTKAPAAQVAVGLTGSGSSAQIAGDFGFYIGVSSGLEGLDSLVSVINSSSELNTTSYNDALYIASVYFSVTDISAVDSSTFGLYQFGDNTTGGYSQGSDNTVANGKICFIGFAEPARTVTIPVTLNNAAVTGAAVTVTGSDGTTYTETTDSSGNAAFQLPDGTYSASVVYKSDSKNYTGSAGSFTVNGDTTVTAIALTETKETATVQVLLKNAQGDAVTLGDATLTIGGVSAAAVEGTAGAYTVAVPLTGSASAVALSGLSGYQNIEGSLANVTVTKDTSGNTKLTSVTSPDSATLSASGGTLTITLKETVTTVTIPLPTPDGMAEDGTSPSADDVAGMTVTFTPVAGMPGTEETLAETGGAVTVTPTVDSEGSITVSPSLPDGVYEMTIGGTVEGAATVPVTVTTGENGAVTVTVGGTVSAENDTVTVTGGVAATATSDTSTGGNYAIDLTGAADSGATVYENTSTTITGGTATVTSGTTVTGGLLNSSVGDELKTYVVTDPIYYIKVEPSGSVSGQYTATVYLKNVTASSGTFGLYADPALFNSIDGNSVTWSSQITLSDLKTGGGLENPLISGTTLIATWSTAGGAELDASTALVELASVTLRMKNTAKASDLTVKSVTAPRYDETANAAVIRNSYAEDEDYLLALGGYWRHEDNEALSAYDPDTDKGHVYLTSGAVNGGYFQAYSGTWSTDMRTVVEMPEAVEKLQADFKVLDTAGAAVSGVTVTLYDSTGTEITSKTTGDDGRVSFPLDKTGGSYGFSVADEKGGYWAYPNGTAVQVDATMDAFTIATDGSITVSGTYDAGKLVDGVIQVTLAPKDYHLVKVTVKTGDNAYSNAILTLQGAERAYNGVAYTFTLKPAAGWDWKLGENETLKSAVDSGKIKVLLYSADPSGTTEDTMYQSGTGTTPENCLDWDPTSQTFTLSGESITGAPPAVSTAPTDAWYDALRCGNIVVVVDNSDSTNLILAKTSSAVTVTADAHVGITVAEPDPTRGTGTDTDNPESSGYTVDGNAPTLDTDGGFAVAAGDNGHTVVETLNNGRADSAVYTFTPAEGYVIDQVYVNGDPLTLTDTQKADGFTYQVVNVDGPKSIVVTVADVNGDSLSDAIVSLTLGSFGTAKFSQDATGLGAAYKTTDADITGPLEAAIYSFKQDDDGLTVTIQAENGYQIDQVYVDGEAYDISGAGVTNDSTTVYTGALTITFDKDAMAAGESHTIVATFKDDDPDAASVQAAVRAEVVEGYGAVQHNGTRIVPVGTPVTLTMTPGSAEWSVGTVTVTDPDGSTSGITAVETDGVWTCATGDLAEGLTVVQVTFTEKTYRVVGKIGIVGNGVKETVKAADLLFLRDVKTGETDAETFARNSQTLTASGVTILSFDVELPAGTYELTVRKNGYLDYIISGFTVGSDQINDTANNRIIFGLQTGTETVDLDHANVISLTCGDATWDHRVVSAGDIGMVSSGWAAGSSAAAAEMGDVNESTACNTDDMGLVLYYLNQGRTWVNYEEFCQAPTT